MPKPAKTDTDEAWVLAASTPPTRCRICRESGKAERCRALIAVMAKAKRRVSFDKIAAKLVEDCGGPALALNSVRLHLQKHEPAWAELVRGLGK